MSEASIDTAVAPEAAESARLASPELSLRAVGEHFGGRVWSRWSDFWFGDTSGAVVAAYRVALGLLNLYWLLTLLQDLDWFFGENSMDTAPRYIGPIWGLFRYISAETWVGPICLAGFLACIGLITGRFVRLSAVVFAVIGISLFRDNGIIWNAGDGLLRILNMLFGISALLLPAHALNAPLFGKKDPVTRERSWPKVPSWVLRLTQIQLTVIYVAAILEKIPGEPWRGGVAAGMALKLETMERFWVPEFVTENLVVVNLITWVTLGLELALPFLLWNKRTRNLAIVAGLAMHAAFDYGLFIGVFSYVMYVCYVAFFPADKTEQALGWLGDRLDDRVGERFGGAVSSRRAPLRPQVGSAKASG